MQNKQRNTSSSKESIKVKIDLWKEKSAVQPIQILQAVGFWLKHCQLSGWYGWGQVGILALVWKVLEDGSSK